MKLVIGVRFLWVCLLLVGLSGQISYAQNDYPIPGAYSIEEYVTVLKDKRVGLVVNQTSTINEVLLPDTLLNLGINVVKLFSPEHGIRGVADAGAKVGHSKDEKTGLPIVSLYGKNKKPTAEQLQGVDVMVYDLQDVGARFYTYISTLQYILEACGEKGIDVIVLDRPNPFGGVIDGPILEDKFKSFIGMQNVPVLYGMTPGEYALFLIGEKKISPHTVDAQVIKCKNYTYQSRYVLPVAPSPNLKNMTAIYLYPSLCFFEGTPLSLGRGTELPFQVYGHPKLKNATYQFTPKAVIGAQNPPLKNQLCRGELVAQNPDDALALTDGKINLSWLIKAYQNYPEKSQFFTAFFNLLAGTESLKKAIIAGKSAEEIQKSWAPGIEAFRKVRNKYQLYSN